MADLVDVHLRAGSRALVASDLHLTGSATPVSTMAAEELARAIDGWVGLGVVVVAGNLVELLADEGDGPGASTPARRRPAPVDPVRALDAHPRLVAALRSFAGGEGRQVVVLVGSHDGRLAWDAAAAARVSAALGGARLGLAAEIHLETGRGEQVVRVEPGLRFDPLQARRDPRNPLDTPLGHHVLDELLPAMTGGRRPQGWLDGIADLPEPAAFPAFVGSRLTYRRVTRHLPWLFVPFLLALVLRVPLAYELFRGQGGRWAGRLLALGVGVVIDVLVVGLGLVLVARRTWRGISGALGGSPRRTANDGARDEARDLVTAGYAGLITGHTQDPELAVLGLPSSEASPGRGFYANTGSCHRVLLRAEGRLGLPPVFLPHRQLSWVELEAGAELHVRLLFARTPMSGATAVERLVGRPVLTTPEGRPQVVATYPGAASWPAVSDPAVRLRRIRRLAASAIALAGLVNVVSALTPPFRRRLATLNDVMPLAVNQTAAALVAMFGIALLVVARGVRRGQRYAWAAACALLAVSAGLHLLKGGDLEEAAVALVVLGFLVRHRRAFEAEFDRPNLARAVAAVAVGGVVATLAGTVGVLAFHRRRARPSVPTAFAWAVEHLVGVDRVHLPGRAATFLAPVLLGVGIGLVVLAGLLVMRPVVARARSRESAARAREIVRRHGGDTLAYFALRDDKQYFFSGDSLVAYAVIGGVCLVSPDPVGPPAEHDEVWSRFKAFADDHGWSIAVLGAGEAWLPTYRAAGMSDVYMGDEAVVDVRRFSLEGGRNKALRQAVNRVAKYGYTIGFYDPAHLEPDLEASLRAVMTQSRRGDVERGFSMTLGRIFDPIDHGLLLAVAFAPPPEGGPTGAHGPPVAFCQYVPAAAVDGFSLDLMRRDNGEHPNGITDFIVVRTIEHLRQEGRRGLGLNFATMRAVLAGEAGDRLGTRVERWLLKRMSDSMQIESLWRYNAKFNPDWKPRYAVYDAPEHALPAALAVAKAESFWELPIIGRFLVPAEAGQDDAPSPASAP